MAYGPAASALAFAAPVGGVHWPRSVARARATWAKVEEANTHWKLMVNLSPVFRALFARLQKHPQHGGRRQIETILLPPPPLGGCLCQNSSNEHTQPTAMAAAIRIFKLRDNSSD